MEIRKYDNQITDAIYNSYFNNVQNNIKDLLLNKPYNVDEQDVDNFNNYLIKQNDSNENKIKTIVSDNINKNIDAKETAKQLLDLYYTKTKVNHYNKDSVNDIQNTLKERKIFTYTQFINENNNEDDEYGLDYISAQVKLEISIEIKYNQDKNYYSYEIYNKYDCEDFNISYELFECYEEEIHKSLIEIFEEDKLNTQKGLAYLSYIISIKHNNLKYGYIIDEDEKFITVETYQTFDYFISNFFSDIEIFNLKNIDIFVINQLVNNTKKSSDNVAFRNLFNYCKVDTQNKYKHYFQAAKFDLI